MNDLISYAYDFISYFMLQPSLKKYPIRRIVLFGSVARGDYATKSDIDMFIDMETLDKINLLSREIEKIKTNFFESDRMKKWNKLNIANNVNVTIGELEEKKWDDLRRSMHSHAMVVWDRFFDREIKDAKPYAIMKWSIGVKDVNKRVTLARKLYGYKQKGKLYNGLLKEINARLIAKGVILVPIEHINRLRELLGDMKIRYNLIDVFIKQP